MISTQIILLPLNGGAVFFLLTQWTRLSDVDAERGTCDCPDAGTNRGFLSDRPCNECPNVHYRGCDHGSDYAYRSTMCVYASHEKRTHEMAGTACSNWDVVGFLAFVTSRQEGKHISEYVLRDRERLYYLNSLMNGVDASETFFWLGGRYKYVNRTGQEFWIFEYRGYYEEVPRELLPTDILQALREDRKCLAGHTKLHSTLHARHCDEKLPSVCYSYRQTTRRGEYCEQEPGKQCYHDEISLRYIPLKVYSAPSRNEMKTYFEAQKECKAMNAILATATDEVTFKKTLALATGLERTQRVDHGTWIGLRLSGMGYGGIYHNITDGTRWKFIKFRDPPAHDDKHPSPLPPEKVEGWLEDGTRYDAVALKSFWPIGEPAERSIITASSGCSSDPNIPQEPVSNVDLARCRQDPFQHCAQIFPSGATESVDCPEWAAFAGKWRVQWCYYRQRGYICQRNVAHESDRGHMSDEL